MAPPSARAAATSHPSRSPTALAGIQLLKKGSEAIKYSRSGVAKATVFKLSEDEQTLSWHGAGEGFLSPLLAKGATAKKLATGERQYVKMSEVLDLMLGMESKVFAMHKDSDKGDKAGAPTFAHVSMSLLLVGSLPSFPSAEGEAGVRCEAPEHNTRCAAQHRVDASV